MWTTSTGWRYCKMADRIIKITFCFYLYSIKQNTEIVSSVNISLDFCPLSQPFHRLRGSQELVGRHTQSPNVQVVPWGQHNRRSWWHQVTFKHNVSSFDIVIYQSWFLSVFTLLLCFTKTVEHIWVDIGLPSTLCLVRVWSVTGGSALWQKYAGGGEPELHQPIHCAFPEAVSHLLWLVFLLCCQRVSGPVELLIFSASSWLALSSSRCCRCVREQKTSRDVMSQPSFILAVLLLWNFGLLIVDRILQVWV